ncbi:Pre-rRNA-processing protein esf1 [Lasiodiplodia hormozganensis]|uniref:Pre-rRNA-processing protein esf1 n=1 Tax=Lasiodiplodia hormozganensis TaxID=869390 RepID=A0AA40D1A0_9PEZI|nr:Pre-rRNA-processing protein esf1 [Lasiodiplodia hormozganensis]
MAPSKQKAPKGSASKPKSKSGAIISDPRFSNIHSDPRFRLPSKKSTHVTVDKRFAHMLKDDDFTRKASVDRYGRKITKDAGKKELERMYRVEDEDEDEEDEEKAEEEQSSDDADDDDDVQKELARMDRKYDPAREGGFSSSEDDSDEEDEEEELEVQEEDAFEFPTGGKEAEVEEMEDATPRLAVVNLDWDNVRAADLMAVANSFTPEGGRILNVTVYPSEFGRERMEREELEGPPREIFSKNKKDDSKLSEEDSEEDSDDEEEKIKNELLQEDQGEEFDSKALRQYQLERLRYYYAVITTDSAATARHLYENMDGREYLSSANFFDLRFVPDEVSFDEDKPRDECKRIPDGYRPNDFVTDALTHSRVKLTWDADDNRRKEIQKRAFSQKEIDENDLQAYIGSDSSSDEDSGSEGDSEAEFAATTDKDAKKRAREEKAAKLRAALGLDSGVSSSKKSREADKPVGDMQITFTSGLSSSKDDKKSVFENEPEESTKDKYIRKERERKQRRKERAKARRMGLNPDDPEALAKVRAEEEGEAAADSSDGEAAKAQDDDDDPFNDPFFENPEEERKRAFKEAKKAEKQRRREEREAQAAKSAAERAELELLMAEDEGNSHLRHFDINEIEKAEKKKGKKGKRGKKGKKGGDAEEAEEAEGQEGFEMDTQDPRFKALFENHEFAIDPTNPRFKGTKGMKALLEEGRKKRKLGRGAGGADELEEADVSRGKRARKGGDADDNGGKQQDDLKKLVERVKGKTKKVKA